jgi:hypothetical protein
MVGLLSLLSLTVTFRSECIMSHSVEHASVECMPTEGELTV